MNILAVQNIQYANYKRRINEPTSKLQRSLNVQEENSTKYAEIDYYPYSMSNVQFTGKFFEKYPRQWLKNLLKLDLPCPCCGNRMVPREEIDALPALGVFSGSCLAALKALEPYEDLMKPIEYNITQILKPLAQKYPGIDLQELMVLLSFEYENNLVATQLTLLNELKAIIPELEASEQKEMQSVLGTAKEFILKKRAAKFKRKTFLKDIEEFLATVQDKELRNRIAKEANRMPTSEDSVSAFIMKYKDRTPEEIGQRLIIFSSATLEHITPVSYDGEVTIWECQQCNNKRANDAIIHQIQENPNMIDNLKSHIKILIDRANFLKKHGGDVQSQKIYDYAQEIRDEYLKNIRKDRALAVKIEQEALQKLEFDEIPIADELKEI